MTTASFTVSVGPDSAIEFARMSGDWNPLHTDPDYAARTSYGRPVLHGAFTAGLVSRMAGMHLPGTECLLHSMRLRWDAPMIPPLELRVDGKIIRDHGGVGLVEVTVSDAVTAMRYMTGGYEFGRHTTSESAQGARVRVSPATAAGRHGVPAVLVTGASGGLGSAVMRRLGDRGLALEHSSRLTFAESGDLDRVRNSLSGRPLAGIVHCAWPKPDNGRLTALPDPATAVEYNVAAPLRQILGLARLLTEVGIDDSVLCLVGSTAADPGRHNYRMPLYSLAKGMIPVLTRALATELGPSRKRCASVVFDVLDGGMNASLNPAARIAHEDRSPSGRLPTLDEAAEQVCWVIDNASFLSSGASVSLTGSAAP